MEPAIFLLDEPLSNVDAAFRAVMRTELKHLQRQFRQTMVYVTHDQLEAMTMADRIAVMDHGVLQQVGTPVEVYNNPANIFVARFLGSPGMNLFKGRRPRATAASSSTLVRSAPTRPLPDRAGAARCAAHSARCCSASALSRPPLPPTSRGIARRSLVERIGARTIVHLGRGETAMKVVLDNDNGLRIGHEGHGSTPNTDACGSSTRASGAAIRRPEPWLRSPSAM